MKEINYKNIGNVDYRHIPRIAKPIGLVKTPELVLKMYEMIKQSTIFGYFGKDYITETALFLESQAEKGKIENLSGLGFTILSEDMLNVAVWDKDYPIVLKNQIYGFKEFGSFKPLNLKKTGSFCIWELGIVNYERNLWKKYLQSERKEADKRKYLNSRIEGLL